MYTVNTTEYSVHALPCHLYTLTFDGVGIQKLMMCTPNLYQKAMTIMETLFYYNTKSNKKI